MVIRYGEWQIISGLHQNADVARPNWFSDEHYAGSQTGGANLQGERIWSMSESLASHGSGTYPYNDGAARLCAVHHVWAGDDGAELSWDPGECDPVSPTPTTTPYQTWEPSPGFLSFAPDGQVYVGTVTVSGPPALSGESSTFHTYGEYGMVAIVRDRASHVDDGQEYAPLPVMLQVPGWIDAVHDGTPFQYEVLRVDGYAHIVELDGGPETSACRMDGPNNLLITPSNNHPGNDSMITPYESMPAAEMTAPSSGASATVEFPDMQPQENHVWWLSNSYFASQADPGPNNNYCAAIDLVTDFVYTIKIRFGVGVVPLRWRQRDDGLGISAAPRAVSGSSNQATARHNSYR